MDWREIIFKAAYFWLGVNMFIALAGGFIFGDAIACILIVICFIQDASVWASGGLPGRSSIFGGQPEWVGIVGLAFVVQHVATFVFWGLAGDWFNRWAGDYRYDV